jgi:hypothetical protein
VHAGPGESCSYQGVSMSWRIRRLRSQVPLSLEAPSSESHNQTQFYVYKKMSEALSRTTVKILNGLEEILQLVISRNWIGDFSFPKSTS